MSPATLIRITAVSLCAAAMVGCARGPRLLADKDRVTLDRRVVEYPADLVLTAYAAGMTAPSAMAFVGGDTEYKNALLIAESGVGGDEPQIYGFKPDGTQFYVYPRGTTLPLLRRGFRIYGPVGGMAVSADEKIYVSHRDDSGRGMITAFDFDGNHRTVVADLPANGDYGVTTSPSTRATAGSTSASARDQQRRRRARQLGRPAGSTPTAISATRRSGRSSSTASSSARATRAAGCSAATTSSSPAIPGVSARSVSSASPAAASTSRQAAVILDQPRGGRLCASRAHGIRLPRGLVFNEFGNSVRQHNGMELRGTRPVKDDHDAIVRVPLGGQVWYGCRIYSADLEPIGRKSTSRRRR
jgi:hypothetical protein